jgi:hypothetical protein
MDDWVNEWLRNLPGALANEAVWLALLYGATRAWKHRDRLLRRGRVITVNVTDEVGVTDSVELSGTAVGRSSVSGILTVTPPKKKLPAWEELLWWYIRLR